MLRWRWQRFCAHCGCLVQAAWFAFKWLTILAALGVVWLCVWGLPRPWLDRALAELGRHGIQLQVGQARLDLFNGVALEDVELFETSAAKTPLLAAQKVRVFLNPAEWREGRHGIRSIGIVNGRACLDLGYPNLPYPCMSNIYARLLLTARDVRLTEWTCEAFGAHWHGRGLARESLTGTAASPEQIDLAALLAPLRKAEPPWLKPLLAYRAAVRLGDVPDFTFDFDVRRGAPEKNIYHAELRGGAAAYRGVSFAPWQVAVAVTGAQMSASAALAQGARRLAASGTLALAPPRETAVQLNCDLPSDQVLALLPAAWQRTYTNSGFRVQGSASGEVALGPAPLSNLLAHITGSCRLQTVDMAGVPVRSLRLQFNRDDDYVNLTRIAAEVGTDRQRGRLEGVFATSLQTQKFTAQARTTFDFNALAPVIGGGVSNLLALMRFDERPPECEAGVDGVLTNLGALVVTGRVTATHFAFRNEPVTLASSAFRYDRGVLDLPDAVLVRADGQAHGRVKYNFNENWVELDVTGNAPPHPVAHMIAPGFERIMRKFEFQGPLQLAIQGRVSVGDTLKGTDLRVSAEGERLGWQKILADHASFDMLAHDAHFTFTNVHGLFCGGPFAGAVDLSNVEASTNCRYTVTAIITNANATRLVEMVHAQFLPDAPASTNSTFSGELAAQVQLAGWLDPWKSIEGTGQVFIHNGSIFQVRLFGGLSKMLSKLHPGLGYLSQSEFLMPFALGEGKLKTEDISIKGSVISLKGHGDYQLGGDLNFLAQVQLLRSGILAETLRILTFPVTKLLEFKLIGTLDEPRWRPVNLPKELFLQFD